MIASNQVDFESLDDDTELRMRQAVVQFLDQVQAPDDRRDAERVPFFGPVIVRPVHGEHPRVSAFTRDISSTGIGLLQIMPLSKGQVVVELTPPFGPRVAILTEILWCHSCGEGWYTSGGQFLDILRVWLE
ncbi:MAG: PilZ domain-containing protein [Pirellulales bacterium]